MSIELSKELLIPSESKNPIPSKKEVTLPKMGIATSKKVKIATAVFFGVTAAALFAVGTVFSMGLPVIIAGAVVGVAAMVSAVAARRDKAVVCDDLPAYFGVRTTKKSPIVTADGLMIHPTFRSDLTRLADDLHVAGERSYKEKFKEDFTALAFHSGAGSTSGKVKEVEEKLKDKIVEDFGRILTQRLGEKAGELSEAISTAFCQNTGIILDQMVNEQDRAKYQRELAKEKGVDESRYHLYLEFPAGLAARIRVEGSVGFSWLQNADGRPMEKLPSQCKYKVAATTDINLDGKARIETRISQV